MKKNTRQYKVLQYLCDTKKRKDLKTLAKICDVSIEDIADYICVSTNEINKVITYANDQNKLHAIAYSIIALANIFVFNYSFVSPTDDFDPVAEIFAEIWEGKLYLRDDHNGRFRVIDYSDGEEIITFA